MMKRPLVWAALVVCACARAAPAPAESTGQADIGTSVKSDLPVQELEKLKAGAEGHEQTATGAAKEHFEYHSLDVLKSNGATAQLERAASADAAAGQAPSVHTAVRLDAPGVHRLLKDGQEVTTPTPDDTTTPKIFHGAARLITGSGMPQLPGPPSAVRRSLKPDIIRNSMDHRASYSGMKYSPVDMAEYVFWTGDEKGVTTAIEESLQEGMMTKEEAITFLQEIKLYVEYLRAHYAQSLRNEEAAQEKMRNMMIEQTNAKEAYRLRAGLPYTRGWDLGNSIGQAYGDRQEVKRTYPDPMLQTNVINTSDYDSDGSVVTEEEYEEMMEKLKIADSLYTEYTLEEIIYQLAKMMFSQSLGRDPREARASIQRFMAYLEAQARRGQLPRAVEKRVLDVMVAALTDTVGDHVEQLQARDLGAATAGDRLMHHFFETAMEQPSMSRTLLAAYKDEMLKQPLHKMTFP